MTTPDQHQIIWTAWRKSSYSGIGEDADCVEVAFAPGLAAVRDSKNAAGPMLTFSAPSFAAFLRCVHSGDSAAPRAGV